MIYNQIVTWKSFAIIAMFFIGILFFLVTKSYFDNYKNCQSDIYGGGRGRLGYLNWSALLNFVVGFCFFYGPQPNITAKIVGLVWSVGFNFLVGFCLFWSQPKKCCENVGLIYLDRRGVLNGPSRHILALDRRNSLANFSTKR